MGEDETYTLTLDEIVQGIKQIFEEIDYKAEIPEGEDGWEAWYYLAYMFLMQGDL